MTFADKSIYDRVFHKVTNKGRESAINYIKIFQNAQDLSVSVGNIYSEDQLIHIFLDKFHQGVTFIAQIENHKEELRREKNITDQKYFSIISLHIDFLNLASSSCSDRNNERADILKKKCTFCIGNNHSTSFKIYIRNDKEKSCAAGDSDIQQTERTPRKTFICGSVYRNLRT